MKMLDYMLLVCVSRLRLLFEKSRTVVRVLGAVCLASVSQVSTADERPNIFIAISDDVSFPHASAYGSKMVSTPAFDRVAKAGVLFSNAFCPAPGCSPSRAALLTGRHIWMIEEAGTHASYFSDKYETFPERLAESGYFVGATGKAWGPGNFQRHGREHNPAGPSFGGKSYVQGFEKFLDDCPDDQPFCFWFGSSDAHRGYKKGSGLECGMALDQAEVPAFLPDHPEIRSDLLDYAFEVQRFDNDCDQMLRLLEETGRLENTLVIITSDNGMPFPRAKANCYEYGIHMPLAVSWPQRIPGARVLEDMVGFTDLTATIYHAAGVDPPAEFPVVGRSLVPELTSEKNGQANVSRDAVFCGRERHSSSRFNSLGYPQRAIRTADYLYIYNFRPERWPAGAPQKFEKVVYANDGSVITATPGKDHGGYHDIDACPSLTFLVDHRDDPKFRQYFDWAIEKRPQEELFDMKTDPSCLHNLAGDSAYAGIRSELHNRLMNELTATRDSRVLDGGDVWETYPRVSGLRWFETPEWAKNKPESVPLQEWVEQKRPRK